MRSKITIISLLSLLLTSFAIGQQYTIRPCCGYESIYVYPYDDDSPYGSDEIEIGATGVHLYAWVESNITTGGGGGTVTTTAVAWVEVSSVPYSAFASVVETGTGYDTDVDALYVGSHDGDLYLFWEIAAFAGSNGLVGEADAVASGSLY